jgi:hypothetical protein
LIFLSSPPKNKNSFLRVGIHSKIFWLNFFKY